MPEAREWLQDEAENAEDDAEQPQPSRSGPRAHLTRLSPRYMSTSPCLRFRKRDLAFGKLFTRWSAISHSLYVGVSSLTALHLLMSNEARIRF